jgi:predicted GIY-YIG superfamily endonuclease
MTAPPTGHALIQTYLKTLDGSPGVYRMLDAQARVLYVGKARNLRARVANYARPSGHSARIARMIAETASMMFLTTRTETEALLLEQNLIKQLKPRLQRAAARRQELSQHPDRQGPRLSADPQASRQAQHPGQLFRPLRQRRRGQPDAEPVAEGVPAAQLRRHGVPEPHAALPALSDQALLGALRRGVSTPRICRAVADAERFLEGKSTRSRRNWPRRCRPPRRRWSSSAPPRCATASAR